MKNPIFNKKCVKSYNEKFLIRINIFYKIELIQLFI